MTTTSTAIDLSYGRTAIAVRDAGPGTPVAVILPAMGVAAGYYSPFAEALLARGISVVSPDYPGHGESTPALSRSVNYGYHALADEWLTGVLDATGAQLPGRPVVLLGHSLGGHVALAHLSGHRHASVTALVTVGSASPYWRIYDSPGSLLLKTQFVALVSTIWRLWPGHVLGFGGRQPRRLMREWAEFARTGRLRPRGQEDYESGMAAVDLPALVIDLANDELAPPRAVDHFAGKLAAARVERVHFDKPAGAPGRAVDHFSFARSPEVLDEVVSSWILEHTGEAPQPSGTID